MTTSLPASFLPERFRVLSGSALKLIAIILMLIDHTGVMILYNYPPANQYFSVLVEWITAGIVFSVISEGRFSYFLFSVSRRISAHP